MLVAPLLPRRILATEIALDSTWKLLFLMPINNILVIGRPTTPPTPPSFEAHMLFVGRKSIKTS